jgi:hypothetical protein
LIAIDVQKGEVIADHCGIPHMLGGADRHARTVQIVDAHQHDYRCRAQTGALGAAA